MQRYPWVGESPRCSGSHRCLQPQIDQNAICEVGLKHIQCRRLFRFRNSPQPPRLRESNPPEPETVALACIGSQIAQVDWIAILEFAVFACKEAIQVGMSKNVPVRIHGAVVTGIGIAITIEQDIASLPP